MEELSKDAVIVDLRDIHARELLSKEYGVRAMIRSQELAGERVNEDLRRRLDELDLEQREVKRR